MKVKLGDIVQIVNGSTPSTEIENFWDGDIVWFTPKDLSDQQSKYVYRGARNISEIGFKKNGLTMLPVDSVLLTSRAPIGLLAINKVECCTNQGFKSLIPDKEKVDFEYLYYFLVLHKKDIERIGSGTTFKEVSKAYLSQFELSLPTLSEQRKISRCLSTIDKKIDINTQINAELESLAKTIYDYWFLQFDFPNKEGKPYKSSGGAMVWNEDLKKEIPEGWEVLNACDVAMIDTGYEDANHSTPNGKYPFFTCSNEILRCDDYAFDGKAVLIAGNGDFNVKSYEGKFNAYQRTYVVIPHESSLYGTLYFSALYSVERFRKGSNGSIVKYITKSDVDHIKVINPHNDVNIEILNNILSLIQHNQKENEELISLRDFLLPLLMNGQVGFKDA